MISFFRSRQIPVLIGLFLVVAFFGIVNAQIQRNMCRECQAVTEPDATHCPECGEPLNLCLDCGTANPANVDFCQKCNAPLAEMRVLGSIDPDTRKELKLGRSERAELEKDLLKLNYLLEKNPEDKEKLLFRKGKILHRMEFFSQEALLWREYLQLFPQTSKKAFIQIYLSEALRKWGYLFYSQKKIASASELLGEATEVNPANKDAWQWLGRINMESNAREEARAAYLKALALEPGNPDIIHFLRKLKADIPTELLKGQKKP